MYLGKSWNLREEFSRPVKSWKSHGIPPVDREIILTEGKFGLSSFHWLVGNPFLLM